MNMEFNKAFGAVLVAGIVAMLAGFIAHTVYHPQKLKEDAYPIAAAEDGADASGAAAVVATAEPVDGLLAAADIAVGAKVGKVCAACHTFDAGGANRVGPNIHGTFGKSKAGKSGFAYSDALKAKGGAWDVAALNEFLWNPKKYVPGTKMSFAGIKKPEDRAAVIKWLQSLK